MPLASSGIRIATAPATDSGAERENLVGGVSAYAIQGNGQLSFLNSESSNGSFPAHLSVHPSGQYLLASNYGTGNYPVYRIQPDGSIGVLTSDVQGQGNGTGPNPDRQEGPHAHQILTTRPPVTCLASTWALTRSTSGLLASLVAS